MKFIEHLVKKQQLTESISLSHYYKDIRGVFQKAIDHTLYKLNEVDGHYDVFNITSFAKLKNFIGGNFEYYIEFYMKKTLKQIVEKECNDTPHIRYQFSDEVKIGGVCQGSSIYISYKYCETMIDDFCQILKDIVEDECESRFELCLMRHSFKDEKIALSEFYNKQNVDDVVNVTIHEAVHLVQHSKQKHRGEDIEYRSYLGKQKEFGDAMDNIRNDTPSKRDEQLYYASPQEIAAYSHNIALNIISNNKLDKNNKRISSTEISTYVKEYLQQIFPDLSSPKIRTIFNKYQKRVYLELDRYLQNIHGNKK